MKATVRLVLPCCFFSFCCCSPSEWAWFKGTQTLISITNRNYSVIISTETPICSGAWCHTVFKLHAEVRQAIILSLIEQIEHESKRDFFKHLQKCLDKSFCERTFDYDIEFLEKMGFVQTIPNILNMHMKKLIVIGDN